MSHLKKYAAAIAAVTSILIGAPTAAADEPTCTAPCDQGSDYGYDYGQPGMWGEDYEEIPFVEGSSPSTEGNN